ncbi:MAG: hypothetical protein EXQ61_03410 [Ilumatobacteraceae bacterium]|nr:hypothetical protein [Ilumatobacteraceae bacterium]
MPFPRLRSPLARAVVPVLGGIAFFALFFVGLWLVATAINNRADPGSEIGNRVFEVGKVVAMAKAIATDGPLLLPDLKSPDGVRSIVLDHVGSDPATGWQVYYGFPADRDENCLVTHIQGSRTFTDCEKRTLQVTQLEAPAQVRPIVENQKTLYIDLRGLTASVTTLP